MEDFVSEKVMLHEIQGDEKEVGLLYMIRGIVPSFWIDIYYPDLQVLEKVMDRITEARVGEGGPAAA